MNAFLRVGSAPGPLVTLQEVKDHTRIDGTAESDLLNSYIAAASAAIDGPFGLAGRMFKAQIWDYVIKDFYAELLIPVPGATDIDAVAYFDADNAPQTLTASDYYYVIVRDDGILLQRIDGAQLPETETRDDAVTFTVSTSGSVPDHIKQAALLTVASWYENREMGDLPDAAKFLINLERKGWAGA